MVEVWTAEALYSSWINTSIILLTAALVFYHMTRLEHATLKVPPAMAAFISSGLIITDVIVGVSALIPYILRSHRLLKEKKEKGLDYQEERSFELINIVMGVFLFFLQVGICCYIVKDAISRIKK